MNAFGDSVTCPSSWFCTESGECRLYLLRPRLLTSVCFSICHGGYLPPSHSHGWSFQLMVLSFIKVETPPQPATTKPLHSTYRLPSIPRPPGRPLPFHKSFLFIYSIPQKHLPVNRSCTNQQTGRAPRPCRFCSVCLFLQRQLTPAYSGSRRRGGPAVILRPGSRRSGTRQRRSGTD